MENNTKYYLLTGLSAIFLRNAFFGRSVQSVTKAEVSAKVSVLLR